MRKIIIFFLIIFSAEPIFAQKWLKKARTAQVLIFAYDKSGNMKETQGFLVDANGTILTDYDSMKGATKATAIDWKGVERPVQCILGANSMYNIAKLKIELEEKNKCSWLEPAEVNIQEGQSIYVFPRAKAEKSAKCTQDTIQKAETFEGEYQYYTLSNALNERLSGSPITDEKGNLIGMVQLSSKEGGLSYAIDAKYGLSLHIRPMDAGNNDLKAINIRKALPEGEEDAASFIFLTAKQDTAMYMSYIEDFIKKYPNSTTGYITKAEFLIENKKYADAETTYNQALSQDSVRKDEIHFSWAKQIYNLNLQPKYETYNDWNMEKALNEINTAYDTNPLPTYLNQQGACLYALKRYGEAYEKYMALSKTNMRTAETFLYAAQCKQMTKAEPKEIIALQDSALSTFPTPIPPTAAHIVLMRGNTKAQAEMYREAVQDYNIYEHLSSGQVSAKFYYDREQLEMKCRMFPNALNDIERAAKLAPNEPIFRAEEAVVNYRVGQIEEAITAAKEAIRLDADFPDAYRILGVCLDQKGEKSEAKKYLQIAIEKGDQLAAGVLEKMQ